MDTETPAIQVQPFDIQQICLYQALASVKSRAHTNAYCTSIRIPLCQCFIWLNPSINKDAGTMNYVTLHGLLLHFHARRVDSVRRDQFIHWRPEISRGKAQ